jgi:hypothetical protein
MKKIYIEELRVILKYKDDRSIIKWCEDNDVLIIDQGASTFVFEAEFLETIERPFINKLKARFGEDWESVYKLYKDGNIPALNILNTSSVTISSTYAPTNDVEKKYLERYKSHGKKRAA